MRSVLHVPVADPLAPIIDTLDRVRALRGEAPVHGITAGLLASRGTGEDGWLLATDVVNGAGVEALLDSARTRWGAAPHAAAALAFKSYAYWLALPAVIGYAAARRVPLVTPENVLVRLNGTAPFLEIGLVRPAVAVLAGDPITALGTGGVLALPDEAALQAHLRATLLDQHLEPLLERLHRLVRVGERTLLGSVASGVAYALVRSADALPGGLVGTVNDLLYALSVHDLVDVAPDFSIQRRTCCLAFTLPEPRYCSGCCIPH